MNSTTREIALAAMKQAGLDRRVDMDALYAYWSLAMEHAAGIAQKRSERALSWGRISELQDCAAAIREAAK